jgi:type I restriction enzyme S subunit
MSSLRRLNMTEVTTKRSTAGWTTVVFGDVVRQVKDKVDPEESGLERYVAGEHMDTDDLRLRRWGDIGEGYLGPAFHMRFKPGHVLYGSRRTYLRKVAVADFEGITANTTYVLEPKDPNVLLPELLPFIMQTEAFNQHSVRESKGSVNPYVNFSDLAWYEFALPPIEEQRRVLAMIDSARTVFDSMAALADACGRVLNSMAASEFDLLRAARVPTVELATICSRPPQSGLYKSEEFRGRGVCMVNMGELFGNDVVDATTVMQRIELDDRERAQYALTPNDLLFGRRSVVLEGAGRCVLVGELAEPVVFESSVLRVTVDPQQADSRFVFEWLRSPYGHHEIRRRVTFTTVSGIAGSDVARLPIPLPAMSVQKGIAERLLNLRRQVTAPARRLAFTRELWTLVVKRALGSAA